MTRLLLATLAVLLAACTDDLGSTAPSPSDTVEPQSTPSASAEATTAATASAECVATPESGTAIAEGLSVEGGGTLRDAFAVPLAPELGFGFVVAAEIDGSGMEGDGEIGTWAMGELGGGPIFAANSMAQEFSEWGSAATEGSAADLARDAVANSAEATTAELCVSAG